MLKGPNRKWCGNSKKCSDNMVQNASFMKLQTNRLLADQ